MATLKTRFGPWRPDLPTLGVQSSDIITNVLPSRDGYRPVLRPEPFTEAINAPVLNSVFVTSSSGTVGGFVATREDLFRLEIESFDRVTRNTDEIYTTREGDTWSFERIADQVVATNFSDEIQVFDLDGSINFNGRDISPKARYLMEINGFLFLLFLNEEGLIRPSGVRWSSRNDELNFPEPGTTEAVQTLSDRRILSSRFGDITGGVSGLTSADGVVFQETAVTSVNQVQGRLVFSFDVLEGARGCNAPGSIIQEGGQVYYLSDAGLYVTDGVSSTPFGTSQVDEFIYENISAESLDAVRAGLDVRQKIIYFSFVDSDGEPFTIAYNYDIKEFSLLDSQFQVQVFTRSLTPGFTFDDLDRLSDTLDGLPASLDSDIYKGGGLPLFSAFDADNRLSAFTGTALPATLRTSESEPIEDSRTYVQFTRPLVDTADVTITPITREDLEDEQTIGAAKDKGTEGKCRHRKTARYWALEMNIADGATWEYAQGVQVIYERAGNRRPTTPIVSRETPLALVTDQELSIATTEGFKIGVEVLVPPPEPIELVTFDFDPLVTFDGDRLVGVP